MKYITEVASDVKRGFVVPIGPKTLIVGPSGSGKTTLTQSIELGLTAAASDIAGREKVAEAKLLGSLTRSGKPPTIRLTFNDGSVASYSGKTQWSLPSDIDADRVHPLRELRSALSGSAEKAQRFLLTAFGAAPTMPDIESQLGDSLRPLLRAAWTDDLLGTRAEAASRSRKATTEANAADQTVDAIGTSIPSSTSYEELDNKRRTLQGQQARGNEIMSAFRAADQLQEYRSKLDGHLAQIQRHDGEIARLAAERQQVPSISDAAKQRQQAMSYLIGVNAEGDDCLLCGVASPQETRVNRGAQFHAYLERQQATYAAAQRIDQALSTEQTQRAYHAGQVELIQRMLGAAPEPPAFDRAMVEQRMAGFGAEIAAVEAQMRQVDATRANLESVNRARVLADTMRTQAEAWKSLTARLNEITEAMVTERIEAFRAKVQSFLSPDRTFGITLDPFRFGFLVDGQLQVALSGAEWVQCICAIGAALADDQHYVVLIPEEREKDPEILTRIMEGLTGAPGQVILTSIDMPARDVEGWTIIQTADLDGVVRKPATKRSSGKAPSKKKQDELLEALGWPKIQILRMSQDARAQILDQSLSPSGRSILADGSLFDLDAAVGVA